MTGPENEVEEVTMVVDQDRCIAGGQCELLEPELFLVDDDTAVASVVGSGRLALARAEVVVDRCPAGAISYMAD